MAADVDTPLPSLQTLRAVAVSACCVLLAAALVDGQSPGHTFTADASVTRADGTRTSAQLTAIVNTFATDAEREALLAAVRKGGSAAQDLLASRQDAGVVQVGTNRTPIKYAYARPLGSGELITVVTAEPMHFVGGDLPDAKPKAGYDFGLVLLELDPSRPGSGEVAPATKIRVDAHGAIVTEDYGDEVVRLSNVVRR